MTKKELIALGKKQGYLEYELVVKTLKDDLGLVPDQIEDLVQLFVELGVKILNRKN